MPNDEPALPLRLDKETVGLIGDILFGLRTPATNRYYHLSTAYDPYLKLMTKLGVWSQKAIFEALEVALVAVVPEKRETPSAPSQAINYDAEYPWGDED